MIVFGGHTSEATPHALRSGLAGRASFVVKTHDHVPCLLGSGGVAEQIEIIIVDHAFVRKELEVEDSFPIILAEDDDRDFLHPSGLTQRENLKQFIERAVAAGKDDERLRAQQEVKLPHGEVIELEAKAPA